MALHTKGETGGTGQPIADVEGTMRMLHALTGETDFINHIEILQECQERGGGVTMCEVVDKFVARGREQGIQQGRIRKWT